MNDSIPQKDEIKAEEPESIIKITLDILNIKKFFRTILNFIHVASTDQFIDGLILSIFLIFLYAHANILNFDSSWPMITLYVIIIFIILDLLGANIPLVKRFLFTEEKNKVFLENIKKYSLREIEGEINIRKFTPSNINYFLNMLKNDPNKNYGFILEDILLNNQLSPENLDLIFTTQILDIIREKFIVDLLINCKNQLSKINVINLYNFYKFNDRVVRFIFATQIQSEFLLKQDVENSQLREYYERFQSNPNQEFINLRRKVPWDTERKLKVRILGIFWVIVFFAIFGLAIQYEVDPTLIPLLISGFVVVSGFLSVLPSILVIKYLLSNRKKIKTAFIDNVTQSENIRI